MSFSLNRAQLIGNAGGDPEIRATASGVKVASFSIATSEQWTDKATGEVKERTDWHRIVVWGPPDGSSKGLIGVVEKYVRKGGKLLIEGPLRTRQWEDAQGVKHYMTEVVLSGFDCKLGLLGSPNGRAPGPESQDDYGAGAPAQREMTYAEAKGKAPAAGAKTFARDLDDEVPF